MFSFPAGGPSSCWPRGERRFSAPVTLRVSVLQGRSRPLKWWSCTPLPSSSPRGDWEWWMQNGGCAFINTGLVLYYCYLPPGGFLVLFCFALHNGVGLVTSLWRRYYSCVDLGCWLPIICGTLLLFFPLFSLTSVEYVFVVAFEEDLTSYLQGTWTPGVCPTSSCMNEHQPPFTNKFHHNPPIAMVTTASSMIGWFWVLRFQTVGYAFNVTLLLKTNLSKYIFNWSWWMAEQTDVLVKTVYSLIEKLSTWAEKTRKMWLAQDFNDSMTEQISLFLLFLLWSSMMSQKWK